MWSIHVATLVYMIIVSETLLAKHHSSSTTRVGVSTSIPDTKYEQVIAQRYLFAPFANESTAWPVLTNINNVWQAVALPHYHSQATEGVWLLAKTMTNVYQTNSATAQFQIVWMPLSANNTWIVLSNIDADSLLIISHNEITATIYTAALISSDRIQLILCNRSDATSCRIIKIIPFPSLLANISKITGGLFIDDIGASGWLYIATDIGLHGLDLSTFIIFPYINGINISVSSLARSSSRQTIFVGTDTKLWIHSYGIGNEEWRFEHITGLIDAPITSLVYNNVQDQLYIGQETGITLLLPVVMSTGRFHWFFSRLAGQISNPGSYIGHLPFANITTLAVSHHSSSPDSRVWLGSKRGVMRFDSNSTDVDSWRVFNSARYMPNRDSLVDVLSLTVLSRNNSMPITLGSTAVAVTSKGLAVLRFEMWTLADKAKHFQGFFNQSGRHDKYNLVSTCDMSSWGDIRTCIKGPDDNDGLWTSMHLSSQIFRYMVTKDPAVKASAWKHFEALELLNQVTGISGYPGRSFAKRSDFPPDPDWHLSPVYTTLQFKGDTSSDEIVGHEHIYPLVHDFLASNDSERQRAYILFFNITNHILTHDWYLVGENHTHTSWGIWNPVDVNDNSDFQDDRGLNSLEILTYLLQTYAYSGEERFLDGAKLLIESYQYDVNIINRKMIAVCDGDPSDDELTYLTYFNLVYTINKITSTIKLSTRQKARVQLLTDKLLEYMIVGLDLTHKYKQMEKSPFYNFIYCYVTGQVNETWHLFNRNHQISPGFNCNSLSQDGIWYMQRWPLELINWPQFNSDRLDIQLNIPGECGGSPQSLQMLPPDERSIKKWNYGVYELDDGNGFREEDPTAYLISYWGMRYFNLLGE
ncbi:unnamed protein product [Adineta steineri]|uniref:Uncharacterized protein n=1 Tax=Adineta steineri TaxID=433720 RepID=A0A814D6S9_9BILA|nr:unnamed protein product [Adineta steineri]